MRPLRLKDPCLLDQTPVVVCKDSEPPVFGYTAHCSATHASRGNSRRAPLTLGSLWLSCVPCPRPILQNYRHHKTHNLGHHRHRPTVRNYTNYYGHQQLQSAKTHRHKHYRITHSHWRGPCKCTLLLALHRHTHPSRGLPSAWRPLGSLHFSLTSLTSGPV